MLLFAAREGEVRRFEAADVPSLLLGGIDVEAAAALLTQRARVITEPTVRSSRQLSADALTKATIRDWVRADQAILLLRVFADDPVPTSIRRYLDSPSGEQARTSYKCRNRSPWYVVPDVQKPDAFLSYMSGESPSLVENKARCVCSNAVHAVRLTDSWSVDDLQKVWREPLTPWENHQARTNPCTHHAC